MPNLPTIHLSKVFADCQVVHAKPHGDARVRGRRWLKGRRGCDVRFLWITSSRGKTGIGVRAPRWGSNVSARGAERRSECWHLGETVGALCPASATKLARRFLHNELVCMLHSRYSPNSLACDIPSVFHTAFIHSIVAFLLAATSPRRTRQSATHKNERNQGFKPHLGGKISRQRQIRRQCVANNSPSSRRGVSIGYGGPSRLSSCKNAEQMMC